MNVSVPVASGVVALVTAYSVTLRQTAAKMHTEERRALAVTVSPLLGWVSQQIALLADRSQPAPVLVDWSKVADAEVINRIAAHTDGLGLLRAWYARRQARKVFGRIDWTVAMTGRWSLPTARGGLFLMAAVINGPDTTHQDLDPGLWVRCQKQGRTFADLQHLHRVLGRLYAAGPLRQPPRHP